MDNTLIFLALFAVIIAIAASVGYWASGQSRGVAVIFGVLAAILGAGVVGLVAYLAGYIIGKHRRPVSADLT